jgi:hypothetical protein
MKSHKELEKIFEGNFKKWMINKDFQSFKKTHPTLYIVILSSLIDVNNLK